MSSKAERKRRKNRVRAQITMPGGGAIPQMQPTDPKRERAVDPMQTVLDARRRMMGDRADKVDLRSAMAGEDLGRSLLRADLGPEYPAATLWDAVRHIRRAVAAYDRACGAPSRHPKCLAILTPPDRMEANAESPAFDDRPEADRDRAAVSAYMAVQGWIGYTDAAARSAMIRAVVDDTGISDMPGIILALECVVDGMAGRTPVWRGRSGAGALLLKMDRPTVPKTSEAISRQSGEA